MADTILDLDALLDGTLDAVENIPDYVNPPAGSYILAINEATLAKRKNKAGDDVVQIELTYSVVSTVETKEPPVSDGSLFTERFQHTEEGLKYFKRAARNILNVADLETVTLRDILATLKGNAPFNAVISISSSTVGTGAEAKVYENLRIRPVHPQEETAAA